MQNRVGLILILALVSGAIAAYLGFNVLRDPGTTAAEAAEGNAVPVAVAARDLDVGHRLTPEDVRIVEWPQSIVPAGYATSPSELVGRGLLTPVKMHEPLLTGKVSSAEGHFGLPILIEEGRRGISIRVDDVTGVAGYLLPGTRVDVLVTLDDPSGGEPVTQIVLQNMEVLTAGTMTQRNNDGRAVEVPLVTLDVSPEEAEKLILAANEGRIQLALRNTLDPDTVDTPGARLVNVLRNRPVERPVGRRSTPSRPATIEIYRGTEKRIEPAGGS